MHHPLGMGDRDCIEHIHQITHCLPRRQHPFARQQLRQRITGHVFKNQKSIGAFGVRLIDRHDIGMLDAPYAARLLQPLADGLLIGPGNGS